MMQKATSIFILFCLLFSGCTAAGSQPAATAQPTPLPVVSDENTVVAEGRLVPSWFVQLSFLTGGQVTEVRVEEGDKVKAGDLIAGLGNREELEASIAESDLELFLARKTLADLESNLPIAQTEALEALTAAKEELRDAERRVSGLNRPIPASQNEIDIAKANVAIAKKVLDRAVDDYAPYENKPEDNLTRAGLLQKKADAQKRYEAAVKKLNNLLGVSSIAFEVQQAEAELVIAQERLEQTQEKYDLLMQGPDPKEVEAAEVRIATAETSLAAAKAALNELELRAPIDGTVIDLHLITGQQVSPGQEVMMLVDFSKWYVETDNLTEIEVVDIAPGQKVKVVPDALPGMELSGTVASISNTYEEKRGDITYTVRILMDKMDPRLRWGMTVIVTFEKL